MSTRWITLLTLVTGSAAVAATCEISWTDWGIPAIHVHESSSASFSGPEDPTDEQMSALLDASVTGTPLPDGFTFVESGGEVDASVMGLGSWGSLRFVVTVVDEAKDIQVARLYVDDEIVHRVTEEDRGVEVSDGMAIATLTALFHPLTDSKARVEWEGADGIVSSSSVEY